MHCVQKSTCGKPDAVTCCRTTAGGTTSCRIARDANHCVAPRNGSACVGGKNAGKPCTGVGSLGTTIECPPDDSQFVTTLRVVISELTTDSSVLTSDDTGMFCPEQTSPGAMGISDARKVVETGSPLGGSGNLRAQTLVGTFCLAATGSTLVDGLGHLPATGALSAPGVLDVSGVALLP